VGAAVTARAAALGTLAIGAFAVSFLLMPPDSDGAYQAFDGALYGLMIEHGDLGAMTGHHPLFHVAGLAVGKVLAAGGVERPGHVAVRILSALGAALALLLIARAPGRERWPLGALTGAALFCTWGFLTKAAVGETIVPACAALLWALDLASRPDPRPARVSVALTLALALRADGILAVPGVAAAMLLAPQRPGRLSRAAVTLLATATATAAVYAAIWWAGTGGRMNLGLWLFFLGHSDEWAAPSLAAPGLFWKHLDALSAAVTGRNWPPGSLDRVTGPLFVLGLLAAGVLLRGTGPVAAAGTGAALIVLVRLPFFMWWAVGSPKWSVLTLALAAWLAARLAGGAPRTPRLLRVAGVLLLAGLGAFAPASHARPTARLRENRLEAHLAKAAAENPGRRLVALGPQASLALDVRGTRHDVVTADGSLEIVVEALGREVQSNRVPTLFLFDRWIRGNDPYQAEKARSERFAIDDLPPSPVIRFLKENGRIYALFWDP
jgi:hypothetical protein